MFQKLRMHGLWLYLLCNLLIVQSLSPQLHSVALNRTFVISETFNYQDELRYANIGNMPEVVYSLLSSRNITRGKFSISRGYAAGSPGNNAGLLFRC